MNPHSENLGLLKRLEYFMNKIYSPIMNFPRPARQVVGQSILQELTSTISYVSLANSVKSMRMKHLQTADGHIESLYILLKLSRNKKCISKGFFREVDEELTIIKAMLVKLIRTSTK